MQVSKARQVAGGRGHVTVESLRILFVLKIILTIFLLLYLFVNDTTNRTHQEIQGLLYANKISAMNAQIVTDWHTEKKKKKIHLII